MKIPIVGMCLEEQSNEPVGYHKAGSKPLDAKALHELNPIKYLLIG